jgi:hypothetical protein
MNRKLALRGRDGAMQRGWFARDTVGAGWTTDAREETHGCRCVAVGVVGNTQCCSNGLLFGSFFFVLVSCFLS